MWQCSSRCQKRHLSNRRLSCVRASIRTTNFVNLSMLPIRRRIASSCIKNIRGVSNLQSPTKKTIFSGIQPTGIPHLGNYLGALKGWIKQQKEAEDDTTLIYSLVDLHAITIRQDPAQLKQWRKESLAVLLAIGLDPKRSTIFYQSHVGCTACSVPMLKVIKLMDGVGSSSLRTHVDTELYGFCRVSVTHDTMEK